MSASDLLHLTRIAKRSSGLHARIAAEALPHVDRVWCRTCRREQPVDAAGALANGWPKCCGYTMTIDHPETWGKP